MKMKQIHIFHHIIEYFIVSCMAQPLSRIYKNYLLMPLKDFFGVKFPTAPIRFRVKVLRILMLLKCKKKNDVYIPSADVENWQRVFKASLSEKDSPAISMPLHASLFVKSRIIALYQVGHRTHVGFLRELLADEIVLSRHTVARVLKVFNFWVK